MGQSSIAVFGAGAIGLYLAGRLAQGGSRVTLVARPATAEQLAGHPLRIVEGDADQWIDGVAVLSPAAARGEAFDALLVTVKGHQLVAALDDLLPLISPRTLVVFLQNGIPWWYFQGTTGPWAGRHLGHIDPQGRLAAALPAERILGAVVYKSADLLASGQVSVRQATGDRLVFGAPDGATPAGTEALLAAFTAAGIAAPYSADLRRDVWDKLLGNASFNPLSALSRADMQRLLDYPPTRDLILAVMAEIAAVAAAHGITLPQTPAERVERSRAVGPVRTSMLQDLDRGRPLEVDGILGGVRELAALAGVPTPRLDTLYATASLLSLHVADRAAHPTHSSQGVTP